MESGLYYQSLTLYSVGEGRSGWGRGRIGALIGQLKLSGTRKASCSLHGSAARVWGRRVGNGAQKSKGPRVPLVPPYVTAPTSIEVTHLRECGHCSPPPPDFCAHASFGQLTPRTMQGRAFWTTQVQPDHVNTVQTTTVRYWTPPSNRFFISEMGPQQANNDLL